MADVTPATEEISDDLRELLNAYAPAERIGAGEASARAAAQGVSFGFADEAEAKFLSWKRGTEYKDEIQNVRARYEEGRQEYPKLSTAVELGSSLIGPGGIVAGAGRLGLKTAIKAATSTMGRRVAGQALAGAAQGIGMSEGDLLSGETATQAAMGAGLGAGGQVLGEGASSLIKRTDPRALRQFSQQKAISATGAMTPERRKMSQTQQAELGQWLVENKIVTPGVAFGTVADRAAGAMEASGKEIGAILGKVDDLVTAVKDRVSKYKVSDKQKTAFNAQVDKNFQVSAENIAKRIENEIIKPNRKNPIGSPLVRKEMDSLQELADFYRTQGVGSLKQANEAKMIQGKKTNFKSESIPEGYKQEVYDILKTEMENIVAKTGTLEQGLTKAQGIGILGIGNATQSGTQSAGAVSRAYEAAKKQYGMAKTAVDFGERAADRLQSNRSLGLSEQMGIIQGAMGGGIPGALAMGVTQKAIKRYGDSFAAVGAYKAAQAMEKPGFQFAKRLLDAAAKGPTAFMATHAALMKSSADYREEIGASNEMLNSLDSVIEKYQLNLEPEKM
jgi:hypothetical protein